jgi:hypothetical protein
MEMGDQVLCEQVPSLPQFSWPVPFSQQLS